MTGLEILMYKSGPATMQNILQPVELVALTLAAEEATNWNCNSITRYVVTAPAREYNKVESRVKNPQAVKWSL